jgi:hypothetical protein
MPADAVTYASSHWRVTCWRNHSWRHLITCLRFSRQAPQTPVKAKVMATDSSKRV